MIVTSKKTPWKRGGPPRKDFEGRVVGIRERDASLDVIVQAEGRRFTLALDPRDIDAIMDHVAVVGMNLNRGQMAADRRNAKP